MTATPLTSFDATETSCHVEAYEDIRLACVDDTPMQGRPWSPGEPTANGRVVAAVDDAVAAHPRIEQVLVPLRDSLTLIRRPEEG